MPKLFKDCNEADFDLTDLGLTRYSLQSFGESQDKPSYWWKPTENLIMGYLDSDVEIGDKRWRYYVKDGFDWDNVSRAEFKLILQRHSTKVADVL